MISLALLIWATPVTATPLPMASSHIATTAEPSLKWKGKSIALDALPAELGPGPAAAAGAWAGWVDDHGYQMHLDPLGRVLLISSKKNGKVKRQLKLIADTSKLFDKLWPAPARVAEEPVPDQHELRAPRGTQDDELPEDPGGAAGRWLEDEAPSAPFEYSYEWGSGTWPVDTETCVMFVVDDEKDYADVLERLGELQSYLEPWLPTAKRYTGFSLEKPLIGAYIEHASGMEEWDPDNEVVNRVTQMLFVRRFSQQPFWLVQGFAWHVEFKLRKGIYCFPYRDEFVWATEHTGWSSELKSMFKGRKGDPLKLDEFSHWSRGKYEAPLARISFGMAEFLTRYYPDELSAFAEELRVFREENNRIDLGGGNWKRKVNYRIPNEELERILEGHFGEHVLDDATEFFRKGKSFRMPKRR